MYCNQFFSPGIIYDLIECLHGQLDMNGLTTTSMFFLSPVADSSLAYANIMAEWLSTNKQSKASSNLRLTRGSIRQTSLLSARLFLMLFGRLHEYFRSTSQRSPSSTAIYRGLRGSRAFEVCTTKTLATSTDRSVAEQLSPCLWLEAPGSTVVGHELTSSEVRLFML